MGNLSFEEFKKTCFHTRLKLRIPLFNTYVEKERFLTKGKYDHEKETDYLKELYEKYKRRYK